MRNALIYVKLNVFQRVFTHSVSVVPQVGDLAGVLLPSLRLGGITELPGVTQRQLRKSARSLGSWLWLLQSTASVFTASAVLPGPVGLSAGPCSQRQLGKH